MPKYKLGMMVEVVQADCEDEGNCNCVNDRSRQDARGHHGEIVNVHTAHGGRRDNPHHYVIAGAPYINGGWLWTDAQLKRYHGEHSE